MKKIVSITCLLLICLSLAGCSSKSDYIPSLFDFDFKINNVTYSLPEKIDTFTKNDWTFPEDFKDFDSAITPGNLKSTYLSQGENWFNIEIFNAEDTDKIVKDCPIGRFTYDFSGDLEIYTAGDFKLNEKTLDEVITKYGEPLSQADYSTYTEIIYDKDPSDSIYDRYTFRFDKETKIIKYLDITNFYN